MKRFPWVFIRNFVSLQSKAFNFYENMRNLLLILMLAISTAVGAQSAERLYNEGKSLYDKERYTEAVPKLKASAEKGHKKAQDLHDDLQPVGLSCEVGRMDNRRA